MSGAPPAEVVLLAPGDVEVARWPLDRDAPVDLAMVEELARVALAARRSGWSVQVCGLGEDLVALVEFTGLAVAVGCRHGRASPQPPTLIQPSSSAATKRT